MVAVAKRKDIDQVFGSRLRALRERAGLTLMELGDRAGMRYQAVARLERSEREPTWTTFVRLADALGVDLGEFRDPDPADDEPEPRPSGKRK